MENIDVVAILRYGSIGLGFLLALFTYLLISAELKRTEPRGSVISVLKWFMIFSIFLLIIGAIASYFDNSKTIDRLRNEILEHSGGTNTLTDKLSTLQSQLGESDSTINELQGNIESLKRDLDTSNEKSADIVFSNVCRNRNFFNCNDNRARDSNSTEWRDMTPYESKLCSLACE